MDLISLCLCTRCFFSWVTLFALAAWHLLFILPDSAQASHHLHEATLTLSCTPTVINALPPSWECCVLCTSSTCYAQWYASKKSSPLDPELLQGEDFLRISVLDT